MNPKQGNPGRAIKPVGPGVAIEADDAKGGDVAGSMSASEARGKGKVGSTPLTPFRPDKQDGTKKKVTWIEIELVGEDDEPIAGEAYRVELPDKRVASGSLDENGLGRIDGLADDGECEISFPALDRDAWVRLGDEPAPQGRRPEHSPASGASGEGPIARLGGEGEEPGRWHKVRLGDSAQSLADGNGLFWHTIWNHPNNGELANRRGDPNVLCVGDRVFLPAIREHSVAGDTAKRHTFRRRGVPAILRLKVFRRQRRRANESYRIVIDGKSIVEGQTDGEGMLEHFVPPGAKECVVLVGEDEQRITVKIGHLPPLTEISGVQARLNSLGFAPGREDGVFDDATCTALGAFQEHVGLEATGEIDDSSLERLQKLYAGGEL